MKMANLGCGEQIIGGWSNVDRVMPPGRLPGDFVEWEMRDGLPFEDDEIDLAVAHHMIDMLTPTELHDFLRECHRVLKPGGALRISVADTLGAIEAAERGDMAWFAMVSSYANDRDALDYYLKHERKSFLTTSLIANSLKRVHFMPYVVAYGHTVTGHDEITELDSRPNESIWLEGLATHTGAVPE